MTTATYPSAVVNFGTDKLNTVDLIYAADPNTLRAEVAAIETAVGALPAVSTAATGSTWYNDGRTYTNLVSRVNNIESGVVADAHAQYIRKTSDAANVIVAGSAALVPVTITGATGQSANLTVWRSSGAILAYVDPLGNFNGPTNIAGLQDVLMLMGS